MDNWCFHHHDLVIWSVSLCVRNQCERSLLWLTVSFEADDEDQSLIGELLSLLRVVITDLQVQSKVSNNCQNPLVTLSTSSLPHLLE